MLQRTKKPKIETVSEKVAKLISHPNDGYNSSDQSADEATSTKAKVVQFDDEYDLPDPGSTEFRKKNIKLLSEQNVKYRGKISSRKDFDEEEDGNTGSEVSTDDYGSEDFSMKPKEFNMKLQKDADDEFSDDAEDNSDDSEVNSDDTEDNSEDDIGHSTDDDENLEENLQGSVQETNILGKTNGQAEIQKGMCVKNQLNIWEKLLEIRIHSQKLLSKANALPGPENFQNEQKENVDVKRAARDTQDSCVNLLNQLLQLQNSLCNQFSEIKTSCMQNQRKRSLPLADSKLETPPFKRFAQPLEQRFNDFKPYRNSILLKWDDRTKLLTPGAGSKQMQHDQFDIIKKIENALLHRKVLIDKSHVSQNRLKTTSADPVEIDSNAENNEDYTQAAGKTDVYDDTDFYHQQLRELIEYKSSGSTNASDVTKQLVELQKLRQKMKKKVDTRASKGRKIRYNVHKKLINFMAPHDESSWTEESTNELFKSLFS